MNLASPNEPRDPRRGSTLVPPLALALALCAACGGEASEPRSDGTTAPAAGEQATPKGPAGSGNTGLPPAVGFTDVTAVAGIDFVPIHGARGEKLLPETMGGGCAFLDHDGDGDQDLLLVGSTWWPDDERAATAPPSLALYRNDGRGRFEDVTAAAGLDLVLYGMGVAVADYDGDGDTDVFITALGRDHLLRNDDGRFTDVTEAAGVGGAPDAWSTAAGFLDHDGDGDLDLFVGHYVDWSREADLALGAPGDPRAYAPPVSFDGTFPSLFRNDGDGTFTDVSAAAGLQLRDDAGRPLCKSLALGLADFDGDGRIDVFVANDTVRNLLFLNRGDGWFSEQGIDAGVAYDQNGKPTGSMGTDVGHPSPGAPLSLFVGNFADEVTGAYVSQDGFFAEEAMALGLGPATLPAVTFGLLLFDHDLDGRLDLLAANGDLDPDVGSAGSGRTYLQPTQLFWNAGPDAARPWVPVPTDRLGDLGRPIAGRGAAYADIDGDGDLDVLLTQVGAAPLLLRNDQDLGHHHVRCELRGDGGNRDALGAWVELELDGVTQRRQVMPTRSYLSQVERPLTFGLGASTGPATMTITWPDGTLQVLDEVPVDEAFVVHKPEPPDVERLLNLSKAHLENGDNQAAVEALTAVVAAAPRSAPALRNLARAYLALGRPEQAAEWIERARAVAPDHASTLYLAGVALARQSRFEEALPELERVASLDPETAAIRFQLAHAYEATGRDEQAHEQLRETVRLDPAHAAAQFRLAMRARKAGDMDAFRQRNREFLRLKQVYGDRYTTPLSLEACRHTKAEGAEPPPAGLLAPPPALEVSFVDATARLFPDGGPQLAATAVIDMDEEGGYLLFTAAADGTLGLLSLPVGGPATWEPLELSLPGLGRVRSCIAGNFHDLVPPQTARADTRFRYDDVFLLGDDGAHLLQRTGPDTFEDVTDRAGLAGVTGAAARWVDHEHDGDLDLAVASADGVALLQNNGDGTFTEVGEEVGLPVLAGGVDLAAVDLHDDDAVDLVVARGEAPTGVVENQRAGRFAALPEPPGPWPAARRVLTDDLDNDGRADALLLGRDEAVVMLGGVPTTRFDLGPLQVEDAVLIDHDNDGWLDLCAVGRRDDDPDVGALRLWRNGGSGPWADVTDALLDGVATPVPLLEVTALDADGDGDSDLLLVGQDGRPLVLGNEGGHVHGQLKLRVAAMMYPSGAVGTQVAVRRGDFRLQRHVGRNLPVEVGLAGHERLDSVQAVWINGVVHNEVDVVPGAEPLDLLALSFADTGSCPFLYTWDGARFRFITDLLGSGAIGLPMSRDVMFPVNPVETVVIGGDEALAPKDGHYLVTITSELREVAYLDRSALVAVDHAPGSEIASTDMLRPPPFRPSELWELDARRPLLGAHGSDGLDRTAALRERDGVHAPTGAPHPPPLRGVCHPLSLELDFGPLPTDRPLVLALTGWIEYGTASTDIALSQNPSIEVIWPRLEARAGSGAWVPLDVLVGMPAGKGKTVLCELDGVLPEGADRLRLTTTYELGWDRIALFEGAPVPPERIHTRPFATAALAWRGFSDLRARAPLQPKTPDFDRVSDRPAWDTAVAGWSTAYGDVTELLLERDGRMVVVNAGDALTLTLPVDALPDVGAGWQRSFGLASVGWNREGDVNTRGGDAVWPLPMDTTHGRTDEEEDAWRLRYNTRWVPADRFAGPR